MSVYVSENPKDELNCLFLISEHPLITLDDGTYDDVCYLKIPYDMLDSVKRYIDRAISEEKDMFYLFTGNLQLRHNFDFSSQQVILRFPDNSENRNLLTT